MSRQGILDKLEILKIHDNSYIQKGIDVGKDTEPIPQIPFYMHEIAVNDDDKIFIEDGANKNTYNIINLNTSQRSTIKINEQDALEPCEYKVWERLAYSVFIYFDKRVDIMFINSYTKREVDIIVDNYKLMVRSERNYQQMKATLLEGEDK